MHLPRPDGAIVIHDQYNALGSLERVDFEWQGGPFVRIDLMQHYLRPPDRGLFQVGPFMLYAIGFDVDYLATVAVRADSWRGWGVSAWWPARQWLDLAYRRLILTLAVWGLADRHQHTMPTWRDVHALRRWAR